LARNSTGGQGFAVNDLLVLPAPGQTCVQPVVLQVTSVDGNGAITGASIQQAGQFILALPSNPVSEFETSGVGHGATVTFETYSVAAVQTLAPGQDFTSAGKSGTALFTGGAGAGAAASVRLTPVLTAGAISTVNAASGGVCGMARIVSAGGLALSIGNPGSGGTDRGPADRRPRRLHRGSDTHNGCIGGPIWRRPFCNSPCRHRGFRCWRCRLGRKCDYE
jgi:hypothetical protein